MSKRAERRRAMSKKGQSSARNAKARTGPIIAAVVGLLAGSVLIVTHGTGIGGPVIAAGIIVPIAWAVLTDPPPAKANTDDAAAMKFGK